MWALFHHLSSITRSSLEEPGSWLIAEVLDRMLSISWSSSSQKILVGSFPSSLQGAVFHSQTHFALVMLPLKSLSGLLI